MPTLFNSSLAGIFEGHEQAMGVHRRRLEVLASNLANAETPGYKARDLDFRAALSEAADGQLEMATTHARHQSNARTPGDPEVLWRVPDQPSLDGNTVDGHREKTAVAETAVRYQTTLTFLTQRIKGLKAAITGGR